MSPIESFRFQYFGIISNTGNAADSADPDGDGRNNLEEFNASTNPLEVTAPNVVITSPAAEPVTVAALADTLHLTATIQQSSATAPLSWAWSKLSGPGVTTFADPNSASTTVTFDTAGTYVLQATATLGGTTASATRTVLVATPATLTFRQGVSGYSQETTFIRADNPTWNSGARNQILVGRIGTSNSATRGLLSFDLSAIPANAIISSASLELTTSNEAGSGSISQLELRTLTTDFTEGGGISSSSGNADTTSGANWNRRSDSTANLSWTNSGGSLGTTILSTLDGYNAATGISTTKTFASSSAFVAAAQSAITTGRINLTIVSPLTEAISAANFTRIHSDDATTETHRPQLRLLAALNPLPAIATGAAPSATAGAPAALTGSATGATSSTWSLVSGPGTASFADPNNPTTTVTFSQPGVYTLRLLSSNANGTVSRTLAVTAVSVTIDPAHFADWQQLIWPGVSDTNITGSAKDPDHDGVANLMEWALHLDATRPDTVPATLGISGTSLQYTYTRRKTAPGAAIYQVEWSETLAGDWSTAEVITNPPVSLGSTSESVTVQIPKGTSKRRFIRLRLTVP